VLGLAVAYLAWQLGVGGLAEPGPGLMSFGLGIAIAGISVFRLGAVVLGRGLSDIEPWTRSGLLRIAGVVGLLALYVAVFEFLGFIVATSALLLVLFGGFAGFRWGWSVVLAVAVTLANYVIFKSLLGTQLPAGIFG